LPQSSGLQGPGCPHITLQVVVAWDGGVKGQMDIAGSLQTLQIGADGIAVNVGDGDQRGDGEASSLGADRLPDALASLRFAAGHRQMDGLASRMHHEPLRSAGEPVKKAAPNSGRPIFSRPAF